MGNLQRAMEAVLNFLTPNDPWNYVVGFLHCIKNAPSKIEKDVELYIGDDVLVGTQTWKLLISE
jgi:hypothetical protein